MGVSREGRAKMEQRLKDLYSRAIEHTKQKVSEDIERFLEKKETVPSFEQYIVERIKYVEQIWINVWLNITNNDVPRKEKKRYLSEKGFEVEAVDKKLINKLFRNEMRLTTAFQVQEWLNEQYGHKNQIWQKKYQDVRVSLFQRVQEEQQREKIRAVFNQIEMITEKTITEDYRTLYLYVRNYLAKKIATDIKNNPKYLAVEPYMLEEKLVEQGRFELKNYLKLENFFFELTGNVHKAFQWEYETYGVKYRIIVRKYIADFVSKQILEYCPEVLVTEFSQLTGEKLTQDLVEDYILEDLNELSADFFSEIEQEYLEDLLRLAEVPFDETEHRLIYEQDLAERENKKQKEIEEIEWKKLEEARILEDIFGREYSPSTGRNIRYVLHIGETNTGKTHHALAQMKNARTGLYLAPLRLLALEVYEKLTKEGVNCGLKTGEEERQVLDATHLACTVEMFYEKTFFDLIVIDESQMIADKDRGFSWYKAITKANAHEVHIIGSRNSKEMIMQLLGDSEIEIHEYFRDIPLEVEKKEFAIKETEKGDALVCFSRRRVLETASKLENDGHSVSMIYGSMPPETRKKQMERFIKKETSIIVATDAIGMGLNLPIRRIVFLENEKFDGIRRRRLTSQEVKQIAGRAGRKGIYNVGKVAFKKDIKVMKRLLEQEDMLISTFAIAPTTAVFERFQKYYRDLSKFFELWEKFESPKGTQKASLAEERELYATIRDTEVEVRFSMMDLYGFLHMPFSKKDSELIKQWRETMFAIIKGKTFPEPVLKNGSLEELELSYKGLGLHLLFLYRLGRGTEALYYERVRQEISDDIHERLKTDVKKLTKKCKSCGKILPWDFTFPICDVCHARRRSRHEERYL